MRIYIAGKIREKSELTQLEEIDKLCKELGHTTFLPHRDVGILKDPSEADKIFEGDITQGMKDIDLVVADLNGLHVGAGTAWELGYAYAKDIPSIGFKTDEPPEQAIEQLSAILLASMPIATSIAELKTKIQELKE